MIIVQKILETSNTLNEALLNTSTFDNYFLVDIETTGFSSKNNQIYLIGCIYRSEGQLNLIQWLCEKGADEYELLYRFTQYIKSFTGMLHYNGTQFDLPFIKKRLALYHILDALDQLSTIDLYLQLKPYQKNFGFENLKLKTVEKAFGFQRKDIYDGGVLIHKYQEFIAEPTKELEALLLLHNEDDLLGLYYGLNIITPLSFYKACRKNLLTIEDFMVNQNTDYLEIRIPYEAQFVAHIEISPYTIEISNTEICIAIPILEDDLNYYFSNYQDYFYLPLEDCVVHKSIGQYVDKDFRIKATKENCYTKKRGIFIPLHKNFPTEYHLFSYTQKDILNYVELTDSLIQDRDFIRQLSLEILSHL